jgi:hypothetical protein
LDVQIKRELIQHLEGNLPDALGRLETLLDADERLQEICTEYEEVALCQRHLSPATGKDQEKFDEYTALLRDLERELLGILTENRLP